jgi:hypothetical protein
MRTVPNEDASAEKSFQGRWSGQIGINTGRQWIRYEHNAKN